MSGGQFEYRILGPLEIIRDGRGVLIRSITQRVVLAGLLLHHGRVVPTDRLLGWLWDDAPPPDPRNALQQHVKRLRGVLGRPDQIVYRHGGYLMPAGAGSTDLARFEHLVARSRTVARDGDPAYALTCLREAGQLWTGSILADVPCPALHSAYVDPLTERCLDVCERRFELELSVGDSDGEAGVAVGVIEELTALCARYPLRERLLGQLMRALHRTGRQAEALETYRAHAERLRERFGLDPGPTLAELAVAVLRGEEEYRPSRTMGSQPRRQETPARRAGPSIRTDGNPQHGSVAAPEGDCLTRPAEALPPDGTERTEPLRAAAPAATERTPAIAWSQPPAPPSDFVGRERLTDTLRALLDADTNEPAVVVLTGPAGVGKTALAVHAAHQLYSSFSDGQLFLSLRGARPRPAEPYEVVERLLWALGVSSEEMPPEPDDRLGMFRSMAAAKRLLILLDDAAGEEQMRSLVPGRGRCALLVTSRRRFTALGYGQVLDVEPFSAEESVELLARVAGGDRVSAEPKSAARVVEQCGFLPLALRIAGAKLAARPHLTLARLEVRLADVRARLDELSYADLAVRTSVAATYEMLDERSRAAFRRLSLIEVPAIPDWLAAGPLGCAPADVERVLDPLVDCRFVEPGADARFRFHDLLRAYGQERAAAEEPEGAVAEILRSTMDSAVAAARYAYECLGSRADHPPGLDCPPVPPHNWVAERINQAPPAWLDLERDTLVSLIVQCGEIAALDQQTSLLAGLLSIHLEMRCWYRDWENILHVGLRCARRRGDERTRAFLLRRLGDATSTQNRQEQAARYLSEAIAISIANRDRAGGAYAYYALGTVRHTQARLPEARDCFAAAQSALADSTDRPAEAHAWYGLGAVHQDSGSLAEALACFQQALVAFREVHDRRGAAHLMRWIASLYIKLERDDEADAMLAECLATNRTLGDRLGEAYALQTIGEHHTQRERWDAGEAALVESEELFRELEVHSGQALVLRTLGDLHSRRGRLPQAERELHSALDLFRTLRMPLGEARTQLVLGDLQQTAGDPAGARESWQAALDLFERLGVPEREEAVTRLG